MELVGRLLCDARDPDHRADRRRGESNQRGGRVVDRGDGIAGQQDGSPRPVVDEDRGSQFGAPVGQQTERGLRLVSDLPIGCHPDGLAQRSIGRWQSDHARRGGTRGRARVQLVAAQLPDRGEMEVARPGERVGDAPERLVEADRVPSDDPLAQAGEDRHEFEIGDRGFDLGFGFEVLRWGDVAQPERGPEPGAHRPGRRSEETSDRVRLERPPCGGYSSSAGLSRTGVNAAVGGRVADAVHWAACSSRKEALEIAHPIAAVTARVDAVVAETASITPRSDRVRVNTEEASGLGDGQGRV
jgi:hypothetical protein